MSDDDEIVARTSDNPTDDDDETVPTGTVSGVGLGMAGPEPPTPVKRVRADALRRANTAWAARVSGATWREAADMAGYSAPEHAIDAVKATYAELPRIERDELRNLWRDRLERSWRQVSRDMVDRVPGSVTSAVRVATAAMTLDGLAEPTKVDIQVDNFLNIFGKELTDAGF